MIKKIFILLFSPFIINAQTAFISGNEIVCDNSQAEAEVKVSFSNGIAPYSFIYAINGISQGSTTTNDNPHYIKTKQEGVYTLIYFSDINTIGSINGSALVTAFESPTAMFSTDADTMSTLYTTLKLQDNSLGNTAFSWSWNFGDGSDSYDQNPYHSYAAQLGIYQISLIVTDNMGCSDTTSKKIWISDYHIMFIPNAFTADNDGVNDLFCIEFNGIRETNFLFKVFDPNSNIVFQSNNPNDLLCSLEGGWNGTNYLTGEYLRVIDPVNKKSYMYSLYYQDFEGWKYQKFGEITLIR
jgi:PKD repeat protein